jgi:hypothetical protein
MKHLYLVLILTFIVLGCNHGLGPEEIKPEEKKTGISGTIWFQNWPPVDSLQHLRLVAFKSFPPADIVTELTSGQAYAYPTISDTNNLPFFVDSTDYIFELPVGTYEYITVAQHYLTVLLVGWRSVGQYDTDETPEPSPVTVLQDSLLPDIDIRVDFRNLPIQPF